VVDVQQPFDGLRRLVPGLLLWALLLPVALLMLLTGLLRLRLRRAVALRSAVTGRLSFRSGLLCRGGLSRAVLGSAFLRVVVLDVDDAALGIERGGRLPRTALATPSPAASPVAPEAPPPSSSSATSALALLPLPDLPIAVHSGLGHAGVARLRRICRGLRGVGWCGGTLSFSIHRLSSIATSSTDG
jgi:hypothetical protein